MRTHSAIVITSVGLLALGICGYLIARKYGVSVVLTRNAAANARSRKSEADELLQRLAADPKLTIGSQTVNGAKRGKKPLVLAVVSRHVLPLLVHAAAPAGSGAYPLLERLGDVDVESVSYQNAEIPSLISELVALQSEHQTSTLSEDLMMLIEGLKQVKDQGAEVIFY